MSDRVFGGLTDCVRITIRQSFPAIFKDTTEDWGIPLVRFNLFSAKSSRLTNPLPNRSSSAVEFPEMPSGIAFRADIGSIRLYFRSKFNDNKLYRQIIDMRCESFGSMKLPVSLLESSSVSSTRRARIF